MSPLKDVYPVHWAIYTNDLEELHKLLKNDETNLEQLDARGRTPLLLAVCLGHRDCVLELLKHGANADAQSKDMWSVSHEAVSLGEPDILREVIKYRDWQRNTRCTEALSSKLKQLLDTPDFYAEMSWEFSSWVPFVSKMCPSDTYKIYKSGTSVRIDTTLSGFEGSSWRRGRQTFIFRLNEDSGEERPQIIIIDHESKSATVQTMQSEESVDDFDPPEEAIAQRLTTPISSTYIDVDKIGFERSRGGFLSWISNSEHTESVNGFTCKVFNACNVDLVTKTRSEHLSAEDKERIKQEEGSNPMASVLNMVRTETQHVVPSASDELGGLGVAEYLDKDFELKCDIGRAREECRKSNTFKATLWLPDDYPLLLQEQVIPIVDLMASNSAHFARLNNFIRMQLPSGFPVKIEIPLFHVVSAKITFGKVNEPGPNVVPLVDDEASSSLPRVTIDDSVFEIPSTYRVFDESSAASWWDPEVYASVGNSTPGRRGLSVIRNHMRTMFEWRRLPTIRQRRGALFMSPLKDVYPVHWAIYTNDLEELHKLLKNDETNLEQLDARGRTPLLLAVCLGHRDCVLELLKHGANADAQSKDMWSVSHEAVSLGEPDILREVIKYRDWQRNTRCTEALSSKLKQLLDTPDFYAEMSWEFSSWVPFVSKMCPSDTYKIYKSGTSVRIDTTLSGFEGSSWRRGRQTFIFRLNEDSGEERPQIIIIDHESKSATVQTMQSEESVDDFDPPEEAIAQRLTTPISSTYIDVDKIGFERSRGGFLSWISNSEHTENVNGFTCKVFNACNVDLVTKTRSEHLSAEDKERIKQEEGSNPMASVLNMVRTETQHVVPSASDELGGLGVAEYLDKDFELKCDIGRAREECRKSNTFKATLWLADDYPLLLQEQVIPIVDLMASNSAHFARLNNFIRMQLPSGFPVKIEIPLFHVVSAKITFGKVNEPGPNVVPLVDDEASSSLPRVTIDDSAFEIPSTYRVFDESSAASWWDPEVYASVGNSTPGRHGLNQGVSAERQEEMLLQVAIQQSLLDNAGAGAEGGAGASEALASYGNGVPAFATQFVSQEDRELALAIQESLRMSSSTAAGNSENVDVADPEQVLISIDTPQAPSESDLELALRISKADEERRAAELREQDAELQKVLELSKLEK